MLLSPTQECIMILDDLEKGSKHFPARHDIQNLSVVDGRVTAARAAVNQLYGVAMRTVEVCTQFSHLTFLPIGACQP